VPASYDPNLFWQMLDEKLDRSGHEDVRIDSIVSMETASPAFEGSLMNEELTVACLISTRDMGLVETSYEGDILLGWAMGLVRMPDEKWYEWGLMDWKQAEEAEIFTFGTYDEIKDGLDIGLNSRDYEILSAASDGENFTIEMRRFGHGVGMSQRGAQVMAGNHDFSYDGILKFYYPGMTLERIDWTSTALPEMDALPDGMIRMRLNIPPRVVDLGELAEGEYFARVSLESAKSRLNVRAEPSTQASIAVRLDHDFRVVVCEDAGDGWVRIRGGSFTGYVKAEYLTAE